MEDPILKFKHCWQRACQDSPLRQKSAVCISTINQDGFPEGRFVDLKALDEQGFVFCTNLDSSKGKHIQFNAKVAMSCWWDHIGLQVRVVGYAEPICEQAATAFWQSRNKEAQMATLCCQQSKELKSESQLFERFAAVSEKHTSAAIPKPSNWGGFVVRPVSIEFLTFRESRLHLRELFRLNDKQWQKSLLQP